MKKKLPVKLTYNSEWIPLMFGGKVSATHVARLLKDDRLKKKTLRHIIDVGELLLACKLEDVEVEDVL